MSVTVDLDARYTVAGYEGIAFYLLGFVRTPIYDAENDEYIRDWLGECDEAYDIDTSAVRAVMVGDDREHIVDVDDLTLIAEDEYCSGCGQVGCTWGS